MLAVIGTNVLVSPSAGNARKICHNLVEFIYHYFVRWKKKQKRLFFFKTLRELPKSCEYSYKLIFTLIADYKTKCNFNFFLYLVQFIQDTKVLCKLMVRLTGNGMRSLRWGTIITHQSLLISHGSMGAHAISCTGTNKRRHTLGTLVTTSGTKGRVVGHLKAKSTSVTTRRY